MTNASSHSKLLQAIFRHASTCPDKVCIYTTDGIPVDYRTFADRILKAALYLQSQGLQKGDRIMLSAQKEVEFIYLYFAAHLCGIINVVVDAKNNSQHLAYISSVVQPSMAFGMEIKSCHSTQYTDLDFSDSQNTPFHSPELKEDDAADIMFTSGTTGNPKGVILTHANIYASASNINSFIRNESTDVELLALPICHSFGLGRLRCNILTGATVVLHNGFANLKSVFSSLEKYAVTGFGMVPAVWAYIKRFSGSRIAKYAPQIKYIEIGSAALPIEDKQLLCDLFPTTRLCMHYGLTEASRAVFMEFHENEADLSTIGRSVVPEVEIRIMNEQGEESAPNEEGEICVKGNMVTLSYYLPQDNADSFLNGYFRTGDWGKKSSDGKIYLVARKKELINVGGKKVSPVEIEDALAKVGVQESMCIAIPDPDGILGEVPKALLVKNSFSKEIDLIKSELSTILEAYKMPRIYEIVDSIPKTASGKKQRTL